MSSEKDNILELNRYIKSDKMPYIIYADIESSIKKQIDVQIIFNVNNWTFDNIKNKHDLSGEKDCMKRFCSSFREHAKNTIDFEKKKMIPFKKKN